jgi:hypothetical protein
MMEEYLIIAEVAAQAKADDLSRQDGDNMETSVKNTCDFNKLKSGTR